MGYEETGYVALCDGCGAGIGEDDECWALVGDGRPVAGDLRLEIFNLESRQVKRGFPTHYCCITPCLEKFVISVMRTKLRALRAASATPPTKEPIPPPLLP